VLVGSARPFEVISGYRCPTTNATLRETRGGGVAKHSLHMEGRAIDVRLPGVSLATCATPPCRSRPEVSVTTRASSCTLTRRVRRW